MKKIDKTGMRFTRLVVIGESQKRGSKGSIYWHCLCDCGNTKEVDGGNLSNGKTTSCGCLAKELSSERAKRIFTKPKVKCLVDGCESDTSKGGKGLCGKHAQRMRRYGDVNYVTPEIVRRVSSRDAKLKNVSEVKKTTYRKMLGRHQHRVVAEQMIGRKLKPDEHVHHKDGNKQNNDPSNLEVMNRIEHLKLHAKERQEKIAAKAISNKSH